MKVAMPVNGQSMQDEVCESFGRAPFFLFYDTESDVPNFVDNVAAKSRGGAGIQAAQSLVDAAADALLTPRCGENAAEVLAAANVAVYKTEGRSIEANLEAFGNGSLPLLHETHPGFHGHQND